MNVHEVPGGAPVEPVRVDTPTTPETITVPAPYGPHAEVVAPRRAPWIPAGHVPFRVAREVTAYAPGIVRVADARANPVHPFLISE